jgi:hypothetical protein
MHPQIRGNVERNVRQFILEYDYGPRLKIIARRGDNCYIRSGDLLFRLDWRALTTKQIQNQKSGIAP